MKIKEKNGLVKFFFGDGIAAVTLAPFGIYMDIEYITNIDTINQTNMSTNTNNSIFNNNLVAFGKENYRILIIGVIIVAIGYMLMIGGGAAKPNEFHADEIFSFRRITLAPILILAGYVIEIFAIMKRPKD